MIEWREGWNGEDARAVVPSSSIEQQNKPLKATSTLVSESPGPLCLGVYQGTESLPLYYVPPSYAKEHADRHVVSGWYICCRPGESFSLRVTPTTIFPQTLDQLKYAGLVATIYLDGRRVRGRFMRFYPHRFNKEGWVLGFTQSAKRDATELGKTEYGYREFQFQRVNTLEDAPNGYDKSKSYDEQSSIQLVVHGARRFTFEKPSPCMTTFDTAKVDAVYEKHCKKAGTSLGVSQGSKSIKKVLSIGTIVYSEKKVELSKFSIVIHVREAYWLLARGIVKKEDIANRSSFVMEIPDTTSDKKPVISGSVAGRNCGDKVLELIDLTMENEDGD